jgi:hypothetical protein
MYRLRQKASARTHESEAVVNVNDAFPSNYIKASDLGDKKILVTIARVEMETLGRGKDAEQKPVVYFEGKNKGLVLNKTNSKKIHDIIGSWEDSDWTGHQIVIYATETEFGGDTVSCVRVLPPPKNGGKAPAKPAPPPPPPAEEFQASDDDVPF